MKLSELNRLTEGAIDSNILLTLQRVIRKGKADNVFEFIVIARILQAQQDGNLWNNPNLLFDPNVTVSKALLDHLKSLPTVQIVMIASRLLETLLSINNGVNTLPTCSPNCVTDLIKLYTAAEAND
jgi:hypothetical protein